ncbi:MAG: hypothetical protein M3O62_14485 [Pseudomonadota bacterium]|nr:hypothetical protein [Pseudomonadota bacterium]
MKVMSLFSKRQKNLRGDVPDVYSYSDIPNSLRTQVVHIWFDALGGESDYRHGQVSSAYDMIVNALCREYGLFRLPPALSLGNRHYMEELINYFLAEKDTEKVLDVVELSFRVIDRATRGFDYLHRRNGSEIADGAIAELNVRFQESGVGYQYVEEEIVRIDSALLHAEVVKPVLVLLNRKSYEGPQQEFLKAPSRAP